MADPKTQNALRNLEVIFLGSFIRRQVNSDSCYFYLQEFATFSRVLGSYPTDVSEA